MQPYSLHVIRHQTQQMAIIRSVELISHYCILGIEIRSRSDIHLEDTRRRSIELHILHVERRFPDIVRCAAVVDQESDVTVLVDYGALCFTKAHLDRTEIGSVVRPVYIEEIGHSVIRSADSVEHESTACSAILS